MSAPRTKRQFAGAASDPAQRQITSFFTSASPASAVLLDPASRTQTAASHLRQSSPLPESVQANLLSVGMRVRKSVPEGYKTGTYSAFALWDETDAGVPANATTMGEGRSRANAISTPRELLPFCGIHKVGGMGTQPETPSTNMGRNASTYQPLLSVNGLPLSADDDHDMHDDDVPGLTSSQETVQSTDSDLHPPPNARKRSYNDDDNEDGARAAPMTPDRLSVNVNAWRSGANTFDFDGEISPRSLGPGSNGRLMAVPRKSRARGVGSSSKLLAAAGLRVDQENVVVMGSDSGDFGEADFLDNSRDWDEVEMRDA
ncbi:ribonucleotide reductase inhibitor-domain-containing protein [Hypoxylon sp. FL1284]|nr:ribonucleotide reductase inhibitor-domain-containing protein [Hypoxylon sp. FL1284]